jgi:P-type Ca2+ transporter type 2C
MTTFVEPLAAPATVEPEPTGQPWHATPAPAVAARLETDPKAGLTASEVAARQQRFGPNELREMPPTPFWVRLLDQFRSFVILILIVAAVLSVVLGDYVEAVAIMAIVLLNAALGVTQESRAEAALSSLQRLAAPLARAVRDGHHLDIDAAKLVPGDVVLLAAGNYVPADVRLTESVNLRVDEAPFTGESVPVSKDARAELPADCPLSRRETMAYRGTIVTYGRGQGVVVATGMETEIGRIAELMQSQQPPPTPLQVKLDELGRTLSLIALVLCGLVFLAGVLRGHDWLDMVLISVSLAIAAVPEGLPAIVTVSLALGMREMVRRHAIIRKLPAVETLGATTIICSDKTGTITQNMMAAVRLYTNETVVSPNAEPLDALPLSEADRKGVRLLLVGGLLCNDARLEPEGDSGRPVGDPTEVALVRAALWAGMSRDAEEEVTPRVDEIPFEAERQRMSTLHAREGRYRLWVKGSPETVLGLSERIWLRGHAVPLTAAFRDHWTEAMREFARNGLRVLAVAYRDYDERSQNLSPEHECELIFVGLIGLADPARPEVRPAVAAAHRAGVRTLMITGDQPLTARAIAAEAGIMRPDSEVLLGSDVEALTVAELAERLEQADVIARAAPAHKVKIVKALQSRDYVVAMTGDGVNDAPALRRAEVGVAMGITGTDVAKDAAEMVLTDDNYASIVSAIEQGRVVYDNIRKFVYYLLSCNVAEILVLFVGTMAGWPPVLAAVQLLWLNLITDGAPALALGMEKGDPDILQRRPRRRAEPIIDRRMATGIAVQSIALTLVTLIAFRLGSNDSGSGVPLAETMAFVTLSSAELLRAYTARSEHHLLIRIGVFSNPYMQYAVGTSLLLLLAVIYIPFLQPIFNTTPLNLSQWEQLMPLIILPSVAAEVLKWWQNRRA